MVEGVHDLRRLRYREERRGEIPDNVQTKHEGDHRTRYTHSCPQLVATTISKSPRYQSEMFEGQ